MTEHWHISTRARADMGDDYPTIAETMPDLLHAVADELDWHADPLGESAHILADGEDYEAAWHTMQRAEHLGVVATNLRTVAELMTGRRHAPLYDGMTRAERVTALDERARRCLGEAHGTELSDWSPYGSYNHLEVWQCDDGADCEAYIAWLEDA